ncbi:retrovirus-related pol polyprotein from transposon TNT 1-94 [Tanacetum coccineum]
MEQDPQMDHDQTNEPSGPHETHDGDEPGQINDEGQPIMMRLKQIKEKKPKPRQDPLKQELSHQDSKIFLYKFPLRSNTPTSTSNQVTSTCFKKAAQDARWREAMQKEVKALEKNGSIMVVVLTYVDDVIITRNNLTKIQETKKQLDDEFRIKDLGLLKYFLGIEVAKTKDDLVLSQQKYTLDILENSGKIGCKPSVFPIEQGLKLDKGERDLVLTAYCDSDWAMASTVSEIIWVRWLLSELHVHNPLATPLFCDNQAARHIANNPVFHERTKHVEMDCYFVRERVESKEIIPMKIADLLTKGLQAHQL